MVYLWTQIGPSQVKKEPLREVYDGCVSLMMTFMMILIKVFKKNGDKRDESSSHHWNNIFLDVTINLDTSTSLITSILKKLPQEECIRNYDSSSFIGLTRVVKSLKKRDQRITRVPRNGQFSSLFLSNQKAKTVI